MKYDEFPKELRSYGYDLMDGEVIFFTRRELIPYGFDLGIPFALFMDDNYIYITHPDNKTDLERGNKESQLKNGLSSKVSESNFYVFAYPSKMVRDIPNEMFRRDERVIKTSFLDLRLDLVDLGVEYGKNSVRTTLNMRSKNSEENILYSFYEIIEDFLTEKNCVLNRRYSFLYLPTPF